MMTVWLSVAFRNIHDTKSAMFTKMIIGKENNLGKTMKNVTPAKVIEGHLCMNEYE